MTVMKATVLGTFQPESATGLPVQHLAQLPLANLVSLILKLSHRDGADPKNPYEQVEKTAHILSDWPNNFHRLLDEIDPGERESGALARRYEAFYNATFLQTAEGKDTFRFIWDEFLTYGAQRGVLNGKLLAQLKGEPAFLSLKGMAEHFELDQRTIAKLIQLGDIPVRKTSSNLYQIDSIAKPFTPRSGARYGEREAAKRLGIPVPTLHCLRASGHYRHASLPRTDKRFHEADIADFSARMRGLPNVEKEGEVISLEDVMLLKFRLEKKENGRAKRSGEAKAEFIRKVLSGEIPLAGGAMTVPELSFFRSDVEEFLRDMRAKSEGNTWSIKETASYIGCDPMSVTSLIIQKQIEAEETLYGTRIVATSAIYFAKNFTPLSVIANRLGILSRALIKRCKELRIPLLEADRTHGKPPQPFIAIEDEPRLMERYSCRLPRNTREQNHDE